MMVALMVGLKVEHSVGRRVAKLDFRKADC